jgi:hypothetical protein
VRIECAVGAVVNGPGGRVTLRMTFGREILCCRRIIGNVSLGASERWHSLSQAEIAGKCHSADGDARERDSCLGAEA